MGLSFWLMHLFKGIKQWWSYSFGLWESDTPLDFREEVSKGKYLDSRVCAASLGRVPLQGTWVATGCFFLGDGWFTHSCMGARRHKNEPIWIWWCFPQHHFLEKKKKKFQLYHIQILACGTIINLMFLKIDSFYILKCLKETFDPYSKWETRITHHK